MRISTSQRFQALQADVASMLLDTGFWGKVAQRAHALHHEVTIEQRDVTFRCDVPAPKQLGKIAGPTLKLVWSIRLREVDFDVDIDVVGFPITMNATGAFTDIDDETVVTYDGDLVVKIPLIGKKIEAQAEPFIQEAFAAQAEVASDWLAGGKDLA